MTDVAVLYGDLSVVRVTWADKLSLRRDQVIAIAVLDPGRIHPRKRQQAVIEFDFYTLVWDEVACYLGGFDDDFYWHEFADPYTRFEHRFPYRMPSGSMLFEGVMISPEDYAEAKRIFGDQRGSMV